MSKEPKIHSTDRALIDAARGVGPVVQVTPDLLEQISKNLNERTADIDARYPKLVEECPYETRLAVVAWAMKAICDHAREGGSFRHLIYDRLGFGMDAYVPLYIAGGMDISNEFDLTPKESPTND